MQTLSSGRTPASPEPALVLEPFRGVRYSARRVSGLAEVTSPPYDVIEPATADALLAAETHNVVRLILPQMDRAKPHGSYADAAATLKSWLSDGVLVPDSRPALYAYEQAGPAGAGGSAGAARVLQRGLIGALGISPPGEGVVLPHEDVVPGPVAGRLELMEAAQANLEPIFLLYDGWRNGQPGAGHPGEPGAAARLVDDVAATRPPLIDVAAEDGLTHRVWAITDPADLDAIVRDLAPRRALIADGHHRYAAYLKLQSRMRAAGAGPGPWDYGLALLVDAAAYPPSIGAIHRVIPGLHPAEAVTAAKQAFRVRTAVTWDGEAGEGLAGGLAALRDAGRRGPAFLVAGAGEAHVLTDPDPDQAAATMPAGQSPLWRGLSASILQRLLLGQIWRIGDDEQTVRVIHHDAYAAVRAADEAGGTAVICNPLTARDVTAVAAQGERVPRKSTSFGPKPRTGLVLRTFGTG